MGAIGSVLSFESKLRYDKLLLWKSKNENGIEGRGFEGIPLIIMISLQHPCNVGIQLLL